MGALELWKQRTAVVQRAQPNRTEHGHHDDALLVFTRILLAFAFAFLATLLATLLVALLATFLAAFMSVAIGTKRAE